MDKSEAQTILNSPVAFQLSNGLGTPYTPASSEATCDSCTALATSTLQTSSNTFIPGPATSQSASFVAGTPTSQGFAVYDHLQPHIPISDSVMPDPSMELFAHSFSLGLSSMDVLKPYSNFVLDKPHDIFLLISNYVLSRAKIDYPNLAEVVAHSGDEVGAVSSALFFKTLGVMLAKFFFNKGLLTIYNALSLSQTALNLIKMNGESQGVFDIESMMKSIANGLYDFVNSFGLINRANLSEIYHTFAEVIKYLSNNIAI